jgi:hypothetical protein
MWFSLSGRLARRREELATACRAKRGRTALRWGPAVCHALPARPGETFPHSTSDASSGVTHVRTVGEGRRGASSVKLVRSAPWQGQSAWPAAMVWRAWMAPPTALSLSPTPPRKQPLTTVRPSAD